jgi:hypothetical protein
MSLVVEDGTGLSTAESYGSVAELQAHRPRGGLTLPAGATTAQCELWLIEGTAWLDGTFGNQWPAGSYRLTDGQALDWPRAYAWDKDYYPLAGVPKEIKTATFEAALVAANSAGTLTKKAETGVKSITIGDISKTYSGSTAANSTVYPAIKQAISRIVRGGSTMGRR